MSNINLRRLNFLANGSVNIDGTAGTGLSITANVVTTNSVTTTSTSALLSTTGFYDSGNTSFYFDPAGSSVLNYPKVSSVGMSLTKMASDSGLSFIAIKSGNRFFNCSAVGATWGAVGTGRSSSSTPPTKSVDHLTHVCIPQEAGEPIDFGMYYAFSFALFANGNLYTWGYNPHGQCGLGNTTTTGTPTLAATNVVAVYQHPTMNGYSASSKMIIKKTDNMLYAAGYNGNGQLGVGDTTNRSSFTQIPNSYNAISVWNLSGDAGALVIQRADYTILACGYNGYGQLGNGNTTSQNYLVDVTSAWGGGTGKTLVKVICGLGYVDSAAANGSYIGMLIDDGITTTFRIAGYNNWGSIGNGAVAATSYSTPQTPLLPSTTNRITDVAGFGGGPGTIMVLYANGDLWNWGYGDFGQLGRGTAASNGTPLLVTTGVQKIFCDGHDGASYPYRRTCFYRKNNLLYGTGYNEHGELGVGNVTTPYTSWTLVPLPANFVCDSIGTYATTSAGFGYIFFGTDGRMFMTGYNAHNMLTWDNTNNSLSPIEIRPPLGG
jgi:alpha-tubulin suppressor-like RCC1 family protein